MIRNECYNIDNKKVLPITTVRLIIYLVKITVQFPGWGGYFFVVLPPSTRLRVVAPITIISNICSVFKIIWIKFKRMK